VSTLVTNTIKNLEDKTILRSSGSVLQVVSTTLDTPYTVANVQLVNGGIAIPGLSASITPTQTTSRILIMVSLSCCAQAANTQFYAWLARGTTKIGAGASADSRIGVTGRFYLNDAAVLGSIPMQFLDSPSTTSSVIYNVYGATETTGSLYVNRTQNDTNNTTNGARTQSTITLMEIAA
jgi:acyl-CoA synthetase (AMP-forming)/AMP-acid ligase II